VSDPRTQLIAFYLSQFHPIVENDEWWGEGFTEWHKAAASTPRFSAHQQPNLPSDLGFYDLRLGEAREEQAALARAYGIGGFCYYVYWFAGRRLLERPLLEMVASGKPDFPFCLCWANENWTRRWDGLDAEVLIAQQHSPSSDLAFLDDHLAMLLDRRYIRVDGMPLLLVYRPDLLADPVACARGWRQAARDAGLPGLYLGAVEYHVSDPRDVGFDALVEFPPHNVKHVEVTPALSNGSTGFAGSIVDYAAAVAHVQERRHDPFPLLRGVMPSWDNSPRRGNAARVFFGSTPDLYRQWLEKIVAETARRPPGVPRMVFINAWNEWGEGAFLEPSQRHGRAYLEATLAALEVGEARGRALASQAGARPLPPGRPAQPIVLVSHDAGRAGAQLHLLEIARHLALREGHELRILLCAGGPLERDFAATGRVLSLESYRQRGGDAAAALAQAVTDLAADRPLLAICNTVVTGPVAAAMHHAGVPVLSMIWELPTSVETYGREALFQAVASSRRVAVASEFARRELAQRFEIDPALLLPLRWGVEPRDAKRCRERHRGSLLRQLGLPADTVLVLGCGSVHPRKGPDLFVQAAIAATRMLGGERLAFCWLGGDQDQESPALRRWCLHDAAAAGIAGRVQFAGEQSDVTPYFSAADVFLLTSREDPYPRVLLEAMAHGVPAVAFEGSGGCAEALGDGAGILVPYLDVLQMARGVVRLAEAPRYREQIAARIAARLPEMSLERTMRDLMAMLRADFGVPDLGSGAAMPLLAPAAGAAEIAPWTSSSRS
jgi:glycosyltransferase involved in cell wall biosynthesis